MTQLNTPYPSTAYLTGFLRGQGVDAVQDDLALQLVLALFTPDGLLQVQARARAQPEAARSASVNFFLDHFERYHRTIAPTRGGDVDTTTRVSKGAVVRGGHDLGEKGLVS